MESIFLKAIISGLAVAVFVGLFYPLFQSEKSKEISRAKKNPGDVNSNLMAAFYLLEMKKTDEVIFHFANVANSTPSCGYVIANFHLGIHYFERLDFILAKKHFEIVIENQKYLHDRIFKEGYLTEKEEFLNDEEINIIISVSYYRLGASLFILTGDRQKAKELKTLANEIFQVPIVNFDELKDYNDL